MRNSKVSRRLPLSYSLVITPAIAILGVVPLLPIELLVSSTAIAQASKSRAAEAQISLQQGQELVRQHDFEAALARFAEAITAYQVLGDDDGHWLALVWSAEVQTKLNLYNQALISHQEALDIARHAQNWGNAARSWQYLGVIYEKLDEYFYVAQSFQQSAELYSELGNHVGQAESLNNLGFAYRRLGQYESALAAYQQCLSLLEALGDRHQQGLVLNNIGVLHQQLEQFDKSLTAYQQALALLQSRTAPLERALTLNNIGDLHASQGHYLAALETLQESLMLTKPIPTIGHNSNTRLTRYSRTLSHIGLVYRRLGNDEAALLSYQQALKGFTQLGDRRNLGITLNTIGFLLQRLGQSDAALLALKQSLTLAQELDDHTGMVITLNNLGEIYMSLGQYQVALEIYQQSLEILSPMSKYQLTASTLTQLGEVSYLLGKPKHAIALFKKAIQTYAIIQSFNPDVIITLYSRLTDILLQENRDFEAQKILDHLTTQAKHFDTSVITISPLELDILEAYE